MVNAFPVQSAERTGSIFRVCFRHFSGGVEGVRNSESPQGSAEPVRVEHNTVLVSDAMPPSCRHVVARFGSQHGQAVGVVAVTVAMIREVGCPK